MGVIDIFKRKYSYTEQTYQIFWNGLSPSLTFLDTFRFKKANKSFRCCICKKEKPKSTRYLGQRYEQVCCDCSLEWIENSKKALQEMEMLLEESKENLKLNKKKWRKEMIFGALQ